MSGSKRHCSNSKTWVECKWEICWIVIIIWSFFVVFLKWFFPSMIVVYLTENTAITEQKWITRLLHAVSPRPLWATGWCSADNRPLAAIWVTPTQKWSGTEMMKKRHLFYVRGNITKKEYSYSDHWEKESRLLHFSWCSSWNKRQKEWSRKPKEWSSLNKKENVWHHKECIMQYYTQVLQTVCFVTARPQDFAVQYITSRCFCLRFWQSTITTPHGHRRSFSGKHKHNEVNGFENQGRNSNRPSGPRITD